ncbi:3 beta-hydroxysteroid dehydrogenase/Delta 5--_4-isomerase [Planctomycetes bacterium Poly30]|uniref:3 beta-hydroxysteroid dehydrogenase/Delta 5-->4-isomerase n=1 Tax=Saltatorellus ferox TaxID=2528018 RepID=A0A518EMD9_9BACT|nr:3 beta-hydroxysteroid dehydrogenase/Delta 5-->4-isomerase [Planctomycetes bacterium Poly30]
MKDLILVTGSTGFIATQTVLRLLDEGYRVRGTVRSQKKGDALRKLVASYRDDAPLEIAVADLLEDEGWSAAMKGCDGLFHMASPFPGGDIEDEDKLLAPAVEGTERVLKAAKAAGIPRAVLTSSVAAVAYGVPTRPNGVFTEKDWSDPQGDGISTYAKSKVLAERKAWDVVADGGPALTTINPSLVLGPMIEDDHGTSIGMIRSLLSGEMDKIPAAAFGIVDVRDVVSAHIKAFEMDSAKGERFIVSDAFMTMEEVVADLRNAYPSLSEHFPTELEDGAIEHRVPSAKKASETLGIEFTPASHAIVATAQCLIDRKLVDAPVAR